MSEDNVELYWAVLETWSAQVDSYWQRTSYFAAFETAAIAGTWEVINEGYRKTGVCLFVFGVILTALWIFNNVKTHGYVSYWWEVLKEIEGYPGWKQRPDYVSQYDDRRNRFGLGVWNERKYSTLTNWVVPIFFVAAWGCLVLIRCLIR